MAEVRQRAETSRLLDRQERLGQHVGWFVRMRWLAAGGAVVLTLLVPIWDLLPAETLPQLLGWCGLLVISNVLFGRWARTERDLERQIVVQAIVDLVILTGLLNASGGLENPLYIAYLFHVIIPGILLPRRKAFGLTAVACALFSLLAFGEFFQVLPHYTNVLFPHGHGDHAHSEAVAPESGPGDEHASLDLVFVAGRGAPFMVVLLLTSYFTTMVAERLRRSEARVVDAARHAMLEHERLESVVDAAGVGFLLVAPDTTIRWFNPRAAGWLDWEPRNLGRPCPLDGTENGCPICIAARTAATGRPLEAERSTVSDGGAVRHFRHATSPVRDEEGRVIQVVELLEEITARKALEAEAMHAGKLSVLGRVAAGIAHEIGNPLSSMETRLRLMARRPEKEFLVESLDVLRAQVARIGGIVRGVSQFARGDTPGWTIWELNAVLAEAVEIVQLDRRAAGVELCLDLVHPSPRVRGVKDQISQVFLNLLLNAVEVTPGGGAVRVRSLRSGKSVGASISDSGPGISPEVRRRLFEPFFTTKKQGTGLGLSISYSLVHAHGGTIEVTSEPGAGSCFTVLLPAPMPATSDKGG